MLLRLISEKKSISESTVSCRRVRLEEPAFRLCLLNLCCVSQVHLALFGEAQHNVQNLTENVKSTIAQVVELIVTLVLTFSVIATVGCSLRLFVQTQERIKQRCEQTSSDKVI
jgi:hypothetical protein